ncbi:MAG TPA: SIS domain-containing protein [Gaiellaceae bacterium]|nr:SIS domain-containing protein [Gaiellaceae bacterium]
MTGGAAFLDEIRSQPAALRALVDGGEAVRSLGRRLAARPPRLVRLVAHGSSDNAASYGVYALGMLAGLTAMRDSISLTVYYRARVPFDGSVVLALSQSGRTPDVVAYVEEARARGALTVAITNDEGSDLAAAAELVLPLLAGPERAVAATKTFVNSLATLALLAAEAAGRGREVAEAVRAAAAGVEEALPGLEALASELALPFASVARMFVAARGVEYATAREVALKLTETCRVAAEPATATELAHGPVAALDRLFPVWLIASDDETLPAVKATASRVLATGAVLVASGCAAARIEGASHVLPTPAPPLPLLSPLLSVVPGQLTAWALARAKGLDPDRPEHLSKVTIAP